MPRHSPLILFGGNFDPPHWGHVKVVQFLSAHFPTGEIRLLPTGYSWQKKGARASAAQRLAMLDLCAPLWQNPHAGGQTPYIDPREIKASAKQPTPTPNYSVDTLHTLRHEQGEKTAFIWVLGMDQFCRLDTWQQWRELFLLTHFLVLPRAPFRLADCAWWRDESNRPKEVPLEQLSIGAAGKVSFVDGAQFPPLPAASQAIRAGDSSQLPPAVAAYVAAQGLYQAVESK